MSKIIMQRSRGKGKPTASYLESIYEQGPKEVTRIEIEGLSHGRHYSILFFFFVLRDVSSSLKGFCPCCQLVRTSSTRGENQATSTFTS